MRSKLMIVGLAVAIFPGTLPPAHSQQQTFPPAVQDHSTDAPSAGQVLPADLLQRCATKALRGDFGKLKSWQRAGYAAALQHGATVQGRAWTTSYYPSEGFPRGQHCRSGIGVSERSAAVRSCDWRKCRGCYVWTAAYGIRVVEDTGANSNHGVACRKGADIWLDYWFPRARNANPVTPYAFIRLIGQREGQR